MTYWACDPNDVAPFVSPASKRGSQGTLCAVALVLGAAVGLTVFYAEPSAPTAPDAPAAAPLPPVQVQARVQPAPAAVQPLRRYAGMFDPTLTTMAVPGAFARPAALRTGYAPLRRPAAPPTEETHIVVAPPPVALPETTLARTMPPQSQAKPVETASLEVVPPAPAPIQSTIEADVPLPTPRPAFPSTSDRAAPTPSDRAALRDDRPALPRVPAPVRTAVAEPVPAPVPPAAAPSGNGFFDRLFGGIAHNALAYAAPEDGVVGRGTSDRYTAVYDIAAHTVTLPNGTRLEAHSGLGDAWDDPRSVAQHMRGATPPNLYELTPREALFHGVRALRLTPTGGTTYGRAGLLTHSYMLRGRAGESNGCVVFRNYPAFLAAYESGQVRRLLVVARGS